MVYLSAACALTGTAWKEKISFSSFKFVVTFTDTVFLSARSLEFQACFF